ncbi:MAG: hypothetical protein HQM10_17385 [Candidatus Riflebacteria bacterium]|nr:hypothetical protein [Candidatus Riflebacteria bacterium]
MNLKKSLVILALMLFFAGSSYAATDPGAFELSQAKKLGVNFTVKKLEFSGPSNPADAYALEIRFSPMTKVQFDALTKAYGGTGFVPYSSSARYELSDFQPPLVQALIGFRFPPIIEEGYKSLKEQAEEFNLDSTICTQSNCYSTVWELVRAKRFKSPKDKGTFCLFWEGEYAFNEKICQAEYGKVITPDSLQPGDAVMFFDRINEEYRSLMHAAVFVDKGLYFEKTDSYDEYAWRFVYYSDMYNKLQKLTESGKLEVEFRRFNGTFPHPTKAFSVMASTDDMPKKYWGKLIMADQPGLGGRSRPAPYRAEDVEIVIDPQLGRGIISPSSPYRKNFKELPWKKATGR